MSREARLMNMYRRKPSTWLACNIDVEPARYREAGDVETFLRARPSHTQANTLFNSGRMTLDSTRSYQTEGFDLMASPGFYVYRWPNGAGKTALQAWMVLWFLDCYPDGAVITTAGTWGQIKDQLWREIPFWLSKARDPESLVMAGMQAKTTIHIDDKWYATARAAAKPETFEGVHSKRVLVIFDEGKAIKPSIYEAARRLLRGSDQQVWWIVMSTPGSPSGPFFDICQSSRWTQHHLTAYESSRISLDEIEDDHQDLGEQSALFWSMILADFPQEAEDTVIPLSVVESCVLNEQAQAGNADCLRSLGIDVARFGGDETSVAVCRGAWLEYQENWKHCRVTATTGRCIELMREYQCKLAAVDDAGVGGGVTDMLYENNFPVLGVLNNAAPEHPERYTDWISEAWFTLGQMMRNGQACIPNDRRLINQLAGRRYELTSDGRRRLQSKNVLRSKGFPSPDRAESYIYGAIAGYQALTQGLDPGDDIGYREPDGELGEFFI